MPTVQALTWPLYDHVQAHVLTHNGSQQEEDAGSIALKKGIHTAHLKSWNGILCDASWHKVRQHVINLLPSGMEVALTLRLYTVCKHTHIKQCNTCCIILGVHMTPQGMAQSHLR